MNKEIKTKWLKALRSGDYEQGRYRLKSKDNKFCCLGVLCDIYAKEEGNQKWKDTEGQCSTMDGNGEFLPVGVLDWSGLKHGKIINVTILNDGWNDQGEGVLTFEEIADLIEADETF